MPNDQRALWAKTGQEPQRVQRSHLGCGWNVGCPPCGPSHRDQDQTCSACHVLPASGLTKSGPGWVQSSSSSGGSLKVALSAVWGRDWLTFEGLFLPEDSLNLDLDFCSATRHGSL